MTSPKQRAHQWRQVRRGFIEFFFYAGTIAILLLIGLLIITPEGVPLWR